MKLLLRRIWVAWTAIAKRIGQAQAWLIFNVIYFAIVGPVAVTARLLTFDPFRRRSRADSYWVTPILAAPPTMDDATRQ